MKIKTSFLLIIFLFSVYSVFCQNVVKLDPARLIEIENLKSNDPIFKEYSYIISDNLKAVSAGKSPELLFFTHTITEKDNSIISGHSSQLLAIASRCNISYDTLATLNGIDNSTTDLMNIKLILPTASGLFIKKNNGKSSLEILLRENYSEKILTNSDSVYYINNEEFVFLPNERFSSTERAYFLDSALRLPLDRDTFWISSEFGKRKNPFSGQWKDHKGIDLAAEEGTPVYAVKDGTAAYCIENDATFGNYVILSHDNGTLTSVYAHLSSFCIKKYDFVKKGDIIGYVGHTGMATGSHLHFEIRQGGIPQDPQEKLKLK